MAQLIVARFNDQLAASSAVNKLLANGVRREQLVIEVHASFIDEPHDAASPTEPVPGQLPSQNTSHRGRTTDDAISPRVGEAPEKMGHSVVSVLVGDLPADELRRTFEGDGANSVEIRDGELPADRDRGDRGTTEAGFSVTQVDRQRALDAARGGMALDESLHRGDVDPMVETGKSGAPRADDEQIKPDDAS